MLIKKYTEDWQAYLQAQAFKCEGTDTKVYLLVDGVFIPGLYRQLDKISSTLLFETLPGCTDETRDVSPFLISYTHTNAAYYLRRLAQCSGFPMISAIVTNESQIELAQRLAAWCIVEVEDQRFNFRFPDTRRLPRIYSVLTPQQQQQLTGPALEWSFVARNGTWENLLLTPNESSGITTVPKINNEQFSKLVEDSESDEITTILQDRGLLTAEDPYLYHMIVSQALQVTQSASLPIDEKIDWCEKCVVERQLLSLAQMNTAFSEWLKSQASIK